MVVLYGCSSCDLCFLIRTNTCEQLQEFWEHEQASTRLNFASKSSKGKILRAVKNFNGPFITPLVILLPSINLCSCYILENRIVIKTFLAVLLNTFQYYFHFAITLLSF